MRSLGGDPVLIGVVGEDTAAEGLRGALATHGIGADALVVDRGRQTTQKTRIIAHHQQVVRADQEDVSPLSSPVAREVLERAIASLAGAGALIVSDYGKGVIERELLLAVLAAAVKSGVPVCVDPKESHFDAYRQASIITPNLIEAGNAFGRRITSDAVLEEVGFGLLERFGCEAVLITRSERGMSLFETPAEHSHFPPWRRRCTT